MRTLLSVYGKFIRSHRLQIVIFVLLSIAHKVVSIYTPIATQRLVDSAVYPSASQASAFSQAVIQNIVLFVLFILLLCLRYYTKNLIELEAESQKKSEILESVAQKTSTALAKKPLGFVLQLISRDVEKSIGLIVYDISVFVLNIIYVIIVFFILIQYSVLLTAISSLLIPLFVLATKTMLPKIEEVNKELNDTRDEISNLTEEVLNGAESIKCSNAYPLLSERVQNRISKYKKLSMRNAKLDILYDFVMVTGTMNAGNMIVYIVGAFQIMSGTMTAGQMTGFALYFSSLWGIVEGFMSFFKQFKVKQLSLKRMKEFDDLPVEQKQGVGLPVDVVESLALKNVSFSYGRNSVLNSCSFTIYKGERVLLTGSNGSGKSTIAKLLVNLIDPDSGVVTLNDLPLNEYCLESLREKVRLIPSLPFLFEGTVEDNLQGLQTELNLLPNFTVDKHIAAMGSNLSGGEKKLLQLSLCLSSHADFFILDEPLNYIDRDSTNRVLAFISSAFEGKTLLIISHQQGVFDDIVHRSVCLQGGTIN